MAKKVKRNYTYALGRRKESTARVRLFKGNKPSEVNGMEVEKYFPGKLNLFKFNQAFVLTQTQDKYYATVKVVGGGKAGQLDAAVLGIARAFSNADEKKFRTVLKKAGLLTRDSRERQRRMVGTGGRARHQKQSPKR